MKGKQLKKKHQYLHSSETWVQVRSVVIYGTIQYQVSVAKRPTANDINTIM